MPIENHAYSAKHGNTFTTIFLLNNGIFLMAATFVSLSCHSILANISFMPIIHLTRAIIILSDIFIITSWIIAIIGFMKKNYCILRWALIFWITYVCLWIAAVAYSLTPTGETYMCSHRRCPESLWMFNNSWHKSLVPRINEYELDDDYKIEVVQPLETTTIITTVVDSPNSHTTKKITTTTEPTELWMIHKHLHHIENSISANRETNLHEIATIYRNNSTGDNNDRPNRSDKMQLDPKIEETDYDDSWVDTLTDSAMPVQMLSNTSLREDLMLVIIISITFSILLIGLFVLLSHVRQLRRQINECCLFVPGEEVNLDCKKLERFDPHGRKLKTNVQSS